MGRGVSQALISYGCGRLPLLRRQQIADIPGFWGTLPAPFAMRAHHALPIRSLLNGFGSRRLTAPLSSFIQLFHPIPDAHYAQLPDMSI